MKYTYYGHACILFDFNGTQVLLDPFVTYNPIAKNVKASDLQPDYIFLTHGHEDHVADLQTVQKSKNATVASIVETAAWVKKQGIPADKVIDFNLGGTLNLPFGKVKMVFAAHSNSTPDGSYGGFPVGYVFFVNEKTMYVSGDTALTMEMKLLERFKVDYAFLPIGGHYTMDAEDAVLAAQFINCQNIIGTHFNSFPPIEIDTALTEKLFSEADLNLTLPVIGESYSL